MIFGSKRKELEARLADQQDQINKLHEENARSLEVRRIAKARRTYGAAVYDRLTADWVTSSASIDSEIRSSLPRLRQRSRQLGRDNDYAKNAFRTIKNNVIGRGVGLQSQVIQRRGKKSGKLDDKTNSAIEMAWWKWSQRTNCDVTGKRSLADILRTIMHSVPESGEIIIREIYQPMGKMRVPIALEVIESDLLDDNYNDVSLEGNEIRMGVEVNNWGRPVAYHFLDRHPGDYSYKSIGSTGRRRIRVPASEIHHLFVPEGRAGQTRGVPWLASAILRLHHMQGYEQAEVVAARASSSLMGFIESAEMDTLTDGQDSGDDVTDFSPGEIKRLAPGEKMNVPSIPRPGGQFDPFMRAMLRGVAAGIGTSYESLSKDYSQSNYSSSRLALLDDRENYKVLQSWIADHFLQPLFEKWLSLAVLSGEIQIKDFEINGDAYLYPRWKFRGWSWIDPAKEVTAYKTAVRSGFMTQDAVISQTSDCDFDELLAQRKREVDAADEAEIVFDTDPKYVSDAGLAQAQFAEKPSITEDSDDTEDAAAN